MHPKQNVVTTADNEKLALGGGSHMGRGQGLLGGGRGLESRGRGLERQKAGLGKAGLLPLKHRDVLGWS